MKNLLAALLACGLAAGVATAQDLRTVLAKARNATVFLTVYFVDSNNPENRCSAPNFGTGFVVTPEGGLLTAQHIFESKECAGFDDVVVEARIGYRNTASPTRLAVVKISRDDDIVAAQLGARRDAYDYLDVCFDQSPLLGSEMLALGFPVGQDFSFLTAHFQGLNGSTGRWNVSANITYGMSGGPVTDLSGRVVGIIKGGVRGAPVARFITPLNWALDELTTIGLRSADIPDCGELPTLPTGGSSSETAAPDETLPKTYLIAGQINATKQGTETVRSEFVHEFGRESSCTEPWTVERTEACLPEGTKNVRPIGPDVISAGNDGQSWFERDPARENCVRLFYAYSDRGKDIAGNCRGHGWIRARWTLVGVQEGLRESLPPHPANVSLEPPAQGTATQAIPLPPGFLDQIDAVAEISWSYALTVRDAEGKALAELSSSAPVSGKFRSEQESNGTVIVSVDP